MRITSTDPRDAGIGGGERRMEDSVPKERALKLREPYPLVFGTGDSSTSLDRDDGWYQEPRADAVRGGLSGVRQGGGRCLTP